MVQMLGRWRQALARRIALPADDLLRDAAYRRLWGSVLVSSFGAQVTMLALPLTAAVLLHASPVEMGWLTAMETLPFVLLSLPAGVWLDRVRKLPVVIGGELALASLVLLVPLAWWQGWLSMPWLYVVAFAAGSVHVVAGSAAQIVLTQVVARERLVEAHAKNALATSAAEVTGPGLAGALIKLLGAPLALVVDATMLAASAALLRGVRVRERPRPGPVERFGVALKAGLRFVAGKRLLLAMAAIVGAWQFCHHAALVVQILVATRTLGLSEQAVGLGYMGMGLGSIAAGVLGDRISRRVGPGPCLVLGVAVCGLGWLLLALAPRGAAGIAAFALMLVLFSGGAVLIFINFLALRQAVTPEPLLGRMTTTMRWLILLPGVPGALAGGWLGQHLGLRSALLMAGGGALLLALLGSRLAVIREVRALPPRESADDALGAEATVSPALSAASGGPAAPGAATPG